MHTPSPMHTHTSAPMHTPAAAAGAAAPMHTPAPMHTHTSAPMHTPSPAASRPAQAGAVDVHSLAPHERAAVQSAILARALDHAPPAPPGGFRTIGVH
jgi:hypothetical protein